MRFAGLSDKIGQGIDIVFKTVLGGGFDFPIFESANNSFRAAIPLARSEEFREFVRRRGSSLSQLDELIVLRYLLATGNSDFKHLSEVLQHGARNRPSGGALDGVEGDDRSRGWLVPAIR